MDVREGAGLSAGREKVVGVEVGSNPLVTGDLTGCIMLKIVGQRFEVMRPGCLPGGGKVSVTPSAKEVLQWLVHGYAWCERCERVWPWQSYSYYGPCPGQQDQGCEGTWRDRWGWKQVRRLRAEDGMKSPVIPRTGERYPLHPAGSGYTPPGPGVPSIAEIALWVTRGGPLSNRD
jgi:hypothetical protein